MWYHEHIGGGRCPIVDTWWQTETGGIMISPLPGATTTKPGSATFPLPGVSAEVVDDQGRRVERGGGYLTLTRPWPGMLRGIWGDPQRYHDTYWSRFEGRYFAGDGAKLDDDGYLWLLGRVDDVMNVSGHRISTTEVESALVSHPAVAEAAVVGATDATTGQAIFAYVILRIRRRRRRRTTCATTSPARSARSPSRRRSSSRPTCPRPAPARSCDGCSATSPRAATSATPARSPTPASSASCNAGRLPEERMTEPSDAPETADNSPPPPTGDQDDVLDTFKTEADGADNDNVHDAIGGRPRLNWSPVTDGGGRAPTDAPTSARTSTSTWVARSRDWASNTTSRRPRPLPPRRLPAPAPVAEPSSPPALDGRCRNAPPSVEPGVTEPDRAVRRTRAGCRAPAAAACSGRSGGRAVTCRRSCAAAARARRAPNPSPSRCRSTRSRGAGSARLAEAPPAPSPAPPREASSGPYCHRASFGLRRLRCLLPLPEPRCRRRSGHRRRRSFRRRRCPLAAPVLPPPLRRCRRHPPVRCCRRSRHRHRTPLRCTRRRSNRRHRPPTSTPSARPSSERAASSARASCSAAPCSPCS